MKKDKYITRWLMAAFLVIFTAILVPVSCKSQLNPTFTSIKTDSVRSRHDTLWITNNSGSISWIRTKGDSLFFGDATGEKPLSIIGTGGGGPGGTLTPGVLDDNDHAYIIGYDDYTLTEYDTIRITPNPIMISITSANILAGDELTVLSASADSAYIPTMYFLSFDAGATPYTGAENSLLKLGTTTIATCGSATFTSANDTQRRADIYSGDTSGDFKNLAITFDLGNFDAGNGTAKLYVWYEEIAIP
jgi:hypothetical protein